MTSFDLTGRVALVTGASRGIGRATCEQLAAMGARVAVSSRKLDACETVVRAIEQAGGTGLAVACNASRPHELEALVARTRAELGEIDVLVANAATNPYFGPLLAIDDAAYDKTLATNVKGVLGLCRLVIPAMADLGGGSVVLTSSIAGLKGTRRLGAYAVSKAALMQLARNLALEWGHAGVRVNCVAPGIVKTDFARALWEDPQAHERALRGYPLGRLGDPEDVAGAIAFLAADASRFVTGQTLVVDGGATIASGDYS